MNPLETPITDKACTVSNAAPHYDGVQRAFHWSMAAIILVALILGLYCSFMVTGTPLRRSLLEWHKSLGLTALMLICFRIAYRLTIRTPPYAEPIGRLAHIAAHGAHLLLYVLMLFMPLTGYLFSAAGGYSLQWFWLFHWPRVVPLDKTLAATGGALHLYGAYVLYAVVTLHILAVVWHRVVKRDGVFARMWPDQRRS